MPRAEQFEDLIAWQKARRLTGEIYRLTRETTLGRDFGLRDQMCRSAVSVMSNLAEGFERSGPREFRHFVSIAKASAGELRSQVYVAFDARHIDEPTFRRLLSETGELGRILRGLHNSLDRACRASDRPTVPR